MSGKNNGTTVPLTAEEHAARRHAAQNRRNGHRTSATHALGGFFQGMQEDRGQFRRNTGPLTPLNEAIAFTREISAHTFSVDGTPDKLRPRHEQDRVEIMCTHVRYLFKGLPEHNVEDELKANELALTLLVFVYTCESRNVKASFAQAQAWYQEVVENGLHRTDRGEYIVRVSYLDQMTRTLSKGRAAGRRQEQVDLAKSLLPDTLFGLAEQVAVGILTAILTVEGREGRFKAAVTLVKQGLSDAEKSRAGAIHVGRQAASLAWKTAGDQLYGNTTPEVDTTVEEPVNTEQPTTEVTADVEPAPEMETADTKNTAEAPVLETVAV